MCTSKEYVRVHGCLWCGATTHPASSCTGPKLPQAEVQMTLKEFNKFQPRQQASHMLARQADAATLRSRRMDGSVKHR